MIVKVLERQGGSSAAVAASGLSAIYSMALASDSNRQLLGDAGAPAGAEQ